VKHFNHYLYERHFQLVTDHRPLTYILYPVKGISVTSAARIQRWALFLSGHDYEISYKNTALHSNVDGLSRLPLHVEDSRHDTDAADVFNIQQVEVLPVTDRTGNQARCYTCSGI
jgi:hypothetical protein